MVVIMVGPVCEGTQRALTQEAAVCSATEPLGNPVPVGRDVVKAARRLTAATSLTWEGGREH
jgi:hypothetical protein